MKSGCFANRRSALWAGLLLFHLCFAAEAQDKPIRLRNEIISTPPASRLAAAAQADAAVTGLFLIQFDDRVRPDWVVALRNFRVELLSYVPEDAFVARVEASRLSQIRALPFVRWVGEFRPEHKVHTGLRAAAQRAPAGEAVGVSVLFSPRATLGEKAAARRTLQRVAQEANHRFGTVLRGTVAPAALPALARSAGVLWIEPAPKMSLFDEVSSRIVAGNGRVNSTRMRDLGYDGQGVTVAVADSGLDSGDIGDMHPDVAGRVTALFFYGNLTDASDEHSHGTHCAGIIAGNGATGEKDDNGALYGLGVAPGVNLIGQRLFDADGGYEPPPTFETMTRDAKRAGADIGSNSWGDNTHGRYDISAMEFDALVRDADALALGDQPYILEFSAGNAGPGAQTIGSPAVAKNVIATGASVNDRFNLPLPEFPIYDTGRETMADFSSRGPCEDGRIKPDVVAPGTWIASLRSVFANDGFAWAPISDRYMFQGGTSQAGPQVSGAAAVFVQYWRETHGDQTPSPAMVKAALINSAVDMDDSVETGPVPNNDEGWGRVDLTELIDTDHRLEFTDQTQLLTTGQAVEHRVLVADPNVPLKITLVYTDVPGFPGAIPALVNDLDLEVVAPDGSVYRGNQFAFGESVPNAPTGDAVNNVEGVHLFAPLAGEYIVRIRAQNVVQDARADTPAVDQDFALVIAGAIVPPGTGIVSFDRRAYTAPALMQIKLFDQNLAGQGTVTLRLRSGAEPGGELITLRAVGSSGVFTAGVATATGPAVTNGRLEIGHGDTIEAIYQDANPPVLRRFTALADLQPPAISNVRTAERFGRILVRFETDEDASVIVYYGTDALRSSITNRFFETTHEVPLTNIVVDTLHRFIVVAEDSAGNRVTNDNGGAFFTFTPTRPATVLLVDAYNNDLFDVPPLRGYTDALNALSVSYDLWEPASDGPVSAALLAPYRCVIWRVGEFVLGTTWSSSDAQAVTTYLAGGGSLFMSSMEFLSRLEENGHPTFARDVLQVQSYVADAGVSSIAGAPSDPLGNGINTALDYTIYEDEIKEAVGISADASDIMVAGTNASPFLLDGPNVVGIRSPRTGQDRAGRVVFLSFPFDAVPLGASPGNNRLGLLRNILNFLVPEQGSSTITLDSDVYTAPGLATVEVEDLDLAGTGTTSVRCFSPVETTGVTVTLAETRRRGLFRGSIALVPADRPPAGSALRVRSGDTFRAEYFDASAGRSATATALVETNAPVIRNVSVDPGYVDATVSWDTSEPADALVQFSDSPGSFPINFTVYDATFELSHELSLERLKPQHRYYFRVISRDRAGNVTVDDNNGELYSFTTLTPLTAPWADRLESGRGDWAVISADESEVAWTLGEPRDGAASPTHAWASNLGGGVASLAETFLISPAVHLTGGNYMTLRFKQNYNFQSRGEFDIFEYGEVLLLTNTTTSPVSLGTVTEFSGGWEDAEYDLSRFRDQVVYVVWRYFLISFENFPRFGWQIDDVSISVSNIVPGTIYLTNNLSQSRYVLSGPASRAGQGANVVLTNMPPGEYRITYGDVPYFGTPPMQSGTLAAMGSLTFRANYAMTDANDNGMSDAWEQEHFGSVSPSRTRTMDTDGDGFTDYEEFAAGTNPMQRDSRLIIATPAMQANGSLRLQWPSVTGRAYRVEGSSDARNWSPVSSWITANGATTTYVQPLPAPGGAYLFRVEVRP